MRKQNWFFLFLTNFVGVFNDNFLKYAVIYVGMLWQRPEWLNQSQLISLLSAAMVIPYLILTPLSGRLAQRFDKSKVLRVCKTIELPIMLLALLAFATQQVWLAVAAVLLMGTQSCLYSPAKYGLIRDIGGKEGASFGSGVFEAMAFLGILLGTMAASFISDHYQFWLLSLVVLLLVGIGIWGSWSIKVKEMPIDNTITSLNPIRFLISVYRFCSGFKGLNLAVFGASMLWFFGAFLQMNLVIHTTHTLQCSNTDSGILLSVAALGIAIGTYVAGKISKQRIKTSLIYVGLVGIVISLLFILLFKPSFVWMFLPVFGISFCGGLFQVPCLAIVQSSNTGRRLGDVVAYMNLLIFLLVLVATALFSVVTEITHQNSYVVFAVILISALLTLFVFFIKRNSIHHSRRD